MSLSAKTLSPFILWPCCCALPRQGWQAQGGKEPITAGPQNELGGGRRLIDTPYFVFSPMPDSLLSTMQPWEAAWSS